MAAVSYPLNIELAVTRRLLHQLTASFTSAEISEVYDYHSSGIVLECLLPDGQWDYLGLTWGIPAAFRVTTPLPRRARLGPQPFRALLRGKTIRSFGLTSTSHLLIELDPPLELLVAIGGRRGLVAVCERDSGTINPILTAGTEPSEEILGLAASREESAATHPFPDARQICLVLRDTGPGPQQPVALQLCRPEDSAVQTWQFPDASVAVETFVREALRWQAFTDQKQALRKALKQKYKKLRRLRENLQSDLREAEKADEYRQYGNLLLAYVGSNPRGQQSLSVPAPDGRGTVEIPLDPAKNRVENANEYFRLARKLEQKRLVASERLTQTNEQIHLLEHQLVQLEKLGTFKELHELASAVGIRLNTGTSSSSNLAKSGAAKAKSGPLDRLLRFRSSDGMEILAGRSAEDNDFLTFRVAKEHDFWFHVAGVPGSHVVVRNPQRLAKCPPRTAQEAAGLAAYLSKLRGASTALVHMTQKRYLKKAKGGRAGEVVMKAFQSLYAKPALPCSAGSGEG